MHIKEGYQRMKVEKNSRSLNNIKKTKNILIGSINTSQINYKKNQIFFIDYQLKQSVKQAKNYIINNIKDKDIFQYKKKSWNNSVILKNNINNQQPSKSKLFQIKYGLLDHLPIKNKSNKIYSGIQSRNDYSGWNCSTSFNHKQKNIGQQTTNLRAIQNTIKFNKSKLWNYKTIDQRFGQSRQRQKAELRNSQKELQNLKKSYIIYNPYASPQKIQANTRKMLYESRRQQLKATLHTEQDTHESLPYLFKAKLSPSQKKNIKYVYFHTGNWQKCYGIEKGNDSDCDNSEYHWSCCLCGERNGKGCSLRVEDKNKMNLAGILHA